MDKRNWNSVYLDGDLPDEVLRTLCDRSYALVFGKLTIKAGASVTNGIIAVVVAMLLAPVFLYAMRRSGIETKIFPDQPNG